MKCILLILILVVFQPDCLKAQVMPQANFQVIAYYSGNGEGLDKYAIGNLTQIIYSFANLKDDTIYLSSGDKREGLKKVAALKTRFPKLKVLVAFGGWGGCQTCSDVFAKPESRKHFAQSVARLIKEYGIDGIDLDWEYPTIPGPPGHLYKPEDKANFSDLIFQIRKAIGPTAELSFAAGGFTAFLEQSVDWNAIMPFVNRVNLMTYDLVHGYSTQTGHHTALYSRSEQKESIDNCVQWLIKSGVSPEKLIIGAAFYARIWENVSNANWGLYKEGKFKQSLDYKDFEKLEPDSGWAHQWDEISFAPYASHKTKFLFATYDNGMSLYEKVKYARKFGLGGIMFWELLCDKPGDGLLESLYQAVENTKSK
jgi:chitinase